MTVTEQFRNSLVSHEAGHFIEYVKSIPQYATSKRQQRKLLSLLVHLGIHSRKDGTTNGELRYKEGRLPKGLYERVLLSGIAYTHKIFYQKDKISWREIYAYYKSNCKTDIREYLKITSSPFRIKKNVQQIMDDFTETDLATFKTIYYLMCCGKILEEKEDADCIIDKKTLISLAQNYINTSPTYPRIKHNRKYSRKEKLEGRSSK